MANFAAGGSSTFIRGLNAAFATARSTASQVLTGLRVGTENYDNGLYFVNRSFLWFDTSAIGADKTITQVNLQMTPKADYTDANYEWDVQIVKQDWSSQNPLSTGNMDAAYDGCLAGTADASILANTADLAVNTPITSGNLATDWVNKTGITYYSLRSSKDFDNTAPSVHGNPGDDQYFDFCEYNHATEAYRPVLIVTYTESTPVDLTAADFTLAAPTFDAPTLVNVAGTVDLTASDFTLAAPTFDAPTLANVWVTPACRTFTIEAESRTLTINAESRTLAIPAEDRGLKITCDSESKYEITRLTYNGLTAADFTLAQPTFDDPVLLTDIVPEPAAELSFVPFYVKDDGDGTFSVFSKTAPYGSFDVASQTGITISKTYYVSLTGDNSNDGLTWDTALRTISTAVAKSDVDRVYIGAGYYGWADGCTNLNSTRNIEIIGVGDVYVSGDAIYYVGAYSNVDNHYTASYGFSTAPKAVIDLTSNDATGNPLMYTVKTSEAEVDAAAGTFYADPASDFIYVRTFDDRAPDANLLYLQAVGFIKPTSVLPITYYLENINMFGGIGATKTGQKYYFKNCSIDGVYMGGMGIEVASGASVILQNTTITRTSDDCIRNNGGDVILIDCNLSYGGDECSSCHGGNMVSVNCEYSHAAAASIHDVGTGKGWYLGAYAHHAGTNYHNFYATVLSGTFETWCDQCISSDSTYDYGAVLPAMLHKHNCTGDATDSGDGVDTYSY